MRIQLERFRISHTLFNATLLKFIVKNIKFKIRQQSFVELREQCMIKQSLRMIYAVGVPMKGAGYIDILTARQRAVITKFRLGTWLWMCKRDGQGNSCVTCVVKLRTECMR